MSEESEKGVTLIPVGTQSRYTTGIAHQEKEKNEETKTGKRGAGGKKMRKQATDFKQAVCCPTGVVQGGA